MGYIQSTKRAWAQGAKDFVLVHNYRSAQCTDYKQRGNVKTTVESKNNVTIGNVKNTLLGNVKETLRLTT